MRQSRRASVPGFAAGERPCAGERSAARLAARSAASVTILATPVARTAATTGMNDPSLVSRLVSGTGAGLRTVSVVRSSG